VVAESTENLCPSIPIAVISLRRSVQRRDAIGAHLRELGLAFQFFDAVDGLTMDAAAVASLRPATRTRLGQGFTKGELGLAASYRQLFREIAEGPDEFVCILEDDARLEDAAVQLLDPQTLSRLPRFDVLRLGHAGLRRKHGYLTVASTAGTSIVMPVVHSAGSFGQIVTRDGARRMAEGIAPLKGPVDWQFYEYSEFPLRILQTPHRVVRHEEFGSTIRPVGEGGEAVPGRILRRARSFAKARSRAHFREMWGSWTYLRALTFRR
jgi:GR25 family glycosyltransferase involved in LPS biosynthesis